MHIQNFVTFYLYVLQILSGNEILMKIVGHKSVTNKQKLTANNLNQDLGNVNAYIKFGEILLIYSQDIERKQNSDPN